MGTRLAAPLLLVAALLATAAATPAHATFPGANGKIAFAASAGGTSGYEIYTIDPDGTDLTRLTNSAGHDIDPSWSPDGTKLAFASQRTGQASCTPDAEVSQLGPGCFDIYRMNADGSQQTQLTNTPAESERGPAWKPDGFWLGFETTGGGLYQMNPNDGSFRHLLWPMTNSHDLTWDPNSGRYAFERNGEIWMIPPSDSSRVLGNGFEPNWSPYQDLILHWIATPGLQMKSVDDARLFPALDLSGLSRRRTSPVWSPNMEWLALAEGSTLALRRPDGDGPIVLAGSVEPIGIDWQRLSATVPGYPRPQSAPSVQAPLVPAYEECIAPDREHGPPLAYPSCSGPQPAGPLTVGTSDSNGRPTRSIGYVKFKAIPGRASTHPDEADVRLELHMTDVRRKSDLADYSGGLLVPIDVQVTDRDNGCCGVVGGPQAATVQKAGNLMFSAGCVPTTDPDVGSTCSVSTTVEALVPAAIQEGVRTTWELGQVRVLDGEDGALFAVQGLFVP